MKVFFYLLLFSFVYFNGYGQDSFKLSNRTFDAGLFANDDTLTINDYLSGIGKSFRTLNKTKILSQSVSTINDINHHMDEDDSAINIIKKRISPNEKVLNIRNVQMFYTLLKKIYADTKNYNFRLEQFDQQLDGVKKEIFQQRTDSITKIILKNPVLIRKLNSQLVILYDKWKNADSTIKTINHLIDNSLARTAASLISIEELLSQTQVLLKTSGINAFSKEARFLWEPRPHVSDSIHANYINALKDEKKITSFYFKDTQSQLYFLFATGIIFFYWIFYNLNSVKRINKLRSLDLLNLKYVNNFPLFTSIIILLSIAPLFDLNAPSIYIEVIVFLLMAVLTIHFSKKLPRNLFYCWIFFLLIFNLLLFIRMLGLPFYQQRNLIFIINCLSGLLGSFILLNYRKKFFKENRTLFFAGILYILFNFFAAFCNLFGRITLTNIFSLTAIYALIQSIGLVIFVQSVKEAFLVQIQGSRIRKGYPEHFEFSNIAKGVTRLVSILAIIIWLIVFTTNLNIYNTLINELYSTLTFPRKIGSFSYSFSGILLFLLIIWVANFLQKYISYFFGDLGEDAAFENVGQHSRLLITRLILLVGGFLLAVLASGLPIDRITVILGALSVGIGLGLQTIVNNFVSGIILIFDRPMRIGDTVEIGNQKGRVKEINIRASTILTPDGAEVIIPNGIILNNNIVNWTLSNSHIRAELIYTLDNSLKPGDLEHSIEQIIKESPNVLNQKSPDIRLSNISAHTFQLKIFFWCKDVTKLEQTKSEVYQAVYLFLESKKINII